ncbi:MAG TPA: histidine phosphatase family protein [Opitutaceae bacterium]
MVERVFFIRHGETAWSESGRHTGRTEIPLSPRGEECARLLAGRLPPEEFARIFVSPRQRARRTCELAGLGAKAETDPDLAEWDYGDYEGLRSAEILKGRPGWSLFHDGCPGGETPDQVSTRADRVITRLRSIEGTVALFSHGHFGRALAARWIALPVADGECFLLDTASIGVLSFEKGNPGSPVIALWNVPPSAASAALS